MSLQSLKTASCFQNHWVPLYQVHFLAFQLGSGDVRPSSVQKMYFPNLCMNRMVLQSQSGAVSPGYCQLFLMLTGWPMLKCSSDLISTFWLTFFFFFLIKRKLISEILFGAKASECSLNVYFLDFNSLQQMITQVGLCLDSDLTRSLFRVVTDFSSINLLGIAWNQRPCVWTI